MSIMISLLPFTSFCISIALNIYHVLDRESSFTHSAVPLIVSMTITCNFLRHLITGLTVFICLALYYLSPSPLSFPTTMPPKPKLNVHNFPRPPALEKISRHIQIKWQNQIIADTKDAFWVLETTHPPSNPPSPPPPSPTTNNPSQPTTSPPPPYPSPSRALPTAASANGKVAPPTTISNPQMVVMKKSKIEPGLMILRRRALRLLGAI